MAFHGSTYRKSQRTTYSNIFPNIFPNIFQRENVELSAVSPFSLISLISHLRPSTRRHHRPSDRYLAPRASSSSNATPTTVHASSRFQTRALPPSSSVKGQIERLRYRGF